MQEISFYDAVWYFYIYAFFGWCLEVAYQAVEHGKFINRGFLNGPYCPIYGFGVILVAGTLYPLKENIIILYAGSVVLTTALEFVTGFILEKVFHQHWWDYSEERFNLKGYICLKFSLLWGVACLVAVRLIHPAVCRFVEHFPHDPGVVLLAVFTVGFASDMTITVLAVIHIRNRLAVLDDISSQMRKISDYTGEKIFDTVEGIMSRKEEIDEKNAELKKRYEELKEKYRIQLEKRSAIRKRIADAFPKLDFDREKSFHEQLEELRRKFNK
ncbi:MAG: hypothetical protein IKQ90_02280 [Ruminococcus sp.]|nr:hypothetical protein [Ruminococcus sp.]